MRTPIFVCLIGFLLGAPAIAQTVAPAAKPDPADVRNLTANYELTNADATLKCTIALETRPAGRGFYLGYDRTVCNPRFGFLGEVSAWLPGVAGAILMIAPDGHIVTEFTEGVVAARPARTLARTAASAYGRAGGLSSAVAERAGGDPRIARGGLSQGAGVEGG
jgi:hypothetical protein